jgi:hypothetical protein
MWAVFRGSRRKQKFGVRSVGVAVPRGEWSRDRCHNSPVTEARQRLTRWLAAHGNLGQLSRRHIRFRQIHYCPITQNVGGFYDSLSLFSLLYMTFDRAYCLLSQERRYQKRNHSLAGA